MRRPVIWLTFLVVTPAGCAGSEHRGLFSPRAEYAGRNPLAAQQLNQEGLAAIEQDDLEAAETAFRSALEADLWYAPAHNNLGLTLLQQGNDSLYEAACAFDHAAKLMPHSACPRHNLALVYERVGRWDASIASYQQALELSPDNIEVMGHLARAYVKTDRRDATIRELLKEVAYRGPEGWDLWAREQLLRLDRD